MPLDTKEEEKIAAEKIAQSSGDETLNYADQLEADSDKLINQLNEQREETGKKAGEQVDELNKNLETEEETKKTEEEGKNPEEEETSKEEKKPDEKKKEVVDDEIKPDDTDTIESLTEKLTKSEKRVKDTRKEFSQNKVEIKETETASQAIISNLNQVVFDLKTKAEELSKATTTKEEKVTEKEIKKELLNLDKQFEILKNVDPEIAEPIKQIIKSIQDTYSTEITTLKTDLKSRAESNQKSAQQIADDNHYGKIEVAHKDWEAIIDSQEFDDYIEGLSPRNNRLAKQDIKNGSAENIIELFDDYKTSAGITKEEPKKPDATKTNAKAEKLKAAQNLVNPVLNKSKEIKTEGTKIKYTRSMIKAMTPEEFKKHEPAIDIELAAGRIPDR